jgi:hypothetical protein
VSLDDWVLALHLLSAFALVGAEVVFTIMIVALWRSDDPRRIASFMQISRVATVLVMAGMLGTVVFGVWLAISLDAYQVWDGWVIASLIVWALASELGRRTGDHYGSAALRAVELDRAGTRSSPELAEDFGLSRGFWLHAAVLVLVVAVLVLMIWKPGA